MHILGKLENPDQFWMAVEQYLAGMRGERAGEERAWLANHAMVRLQVLERQLRRLLVEDLRGMTAAGLSPEEIGERLDIPVQDVEELLAS